MYRYQCCGFGSARIRIILPIRIRIRNYLTSRILDRIWIWNYRIGRIQIRNLHRILGLLKDSDENTIFNIYRYRLILAHNLISTLNSKISRKCLGQGSVSETTCKEGSGSEMTRNVGSGSVMNRQLGSGSESNSFACSTLLCTMFYHWRFYPFISNIVRDISSVLFLKCWVQIPEINFSRSGLILSFV